MASRRSPSSPHRRCSSRCTLLVALLSLLPRKALACMLIRVAHEEVHAAAHERLMCSVLPAVMGAYRWR